MKRVKLVIAYDGTNYCGWQTQPNGITIEEVLNKTLSRLFGEEIKIIGASRTDSGVHALGNVAVFDTNARMPADKIALALNQRLPEDIRIQESKEVPLSFHPRGCKSRKTYEYHILNRRMNIPTERFYSHFIYAPLNVDKMKEAAVYLVGTHDFKSFCSIRTHIKDMVRTVCVLDIIEDHERITLHIEGKGFLYNMVRIIAGTLIRVGLSEIEPERVEEILNAKDRQMAGPTAPANGLTLVEILYEGAAEELLPEEKNEAMEDA